MISFIVSACDHPDLLVPCLATLKVQRCEKEIIVCDNGLPLDYERPDVITWLMTGASGAKNGYESANMAAKVAQGEWLCFPSDDGLTVAGFSEIMLHEAERNKTAGLIYCDCVYRQDPVTGGWPAYKVLDAAPMMGRIDKTNFIIKRELFKGFPPHPKGWSDGALVEQLVRDGVKCAKAPGVLVLHQ